MATKESTIRYLLEQGAAAGVLTEKKMFGEYGLYCDGKLVALVCDDQLFLKPTDPVRQLLGSRLEEAKPYPSAKPSILVPEDIWDDEAQLAQLLKITSAGMPPSKAKKAGAKAKKARGKA